jgi:superfamily II DNA or RNA helicase
MSDLIPVDDVMNPDAPDINLRDYQYECIGALRQGIRDGKKNQVLCAPTGAGKSILATYLLREAFRLGRHALFVVERNVLIEQISTMLDRYGVPHGVVQADHPRRRPGALIQVCSAQTLNSRGWPKADMIIVDESHVMMKVVEDRIRPRNCVAIGLTATPFREGMGLLYDGLVQVTTTNRLTQEGHLIPFKAFAAAEPDMKGVKVSKGEWAERESAERCEAIVGDVVAEYLAKTPGEKAVLFGVTTDHCESMRAQFMAAGIRAELHTYNIPDDTRKANMDEFRRPNSSIKVLMSVSALSRGLDVPDCSVVIMAKPIRKSLSEFVQILGRVLRPFEGQKYATVLDLAGNMERFWGQLQNFFENGAPPLDKGEKKDADKEKLLEKKEKKPKKCPECAHVFAGGPVCPACGFVFPVKSPIEHAAGVLREFMAGQSVSLTPEAKDQLLGELRQVQLEGGWKGPHKPAWIGMKFKSIVGYWPSVDFERIEPRAPSPETKRLLADQFRKYKESIKPIEF